MALLSKNDGSEQEKKNGDVSPVLDSIIKYSIILPNSYVFLRKRQYKVDPMRPQAKNNENCYLSHFCLWSQKPHCFRGVRCKAQNLCV